MPALVSGCLAILGLSFVSEGVMDPGRSNGAVNWTGVGNLFRPSYNCIESRSLPASAVGVRCIVVEETKSSLRRLSRDFLCLLMNEHDM